MNWQCNYFCNQFENIIFINFAGVGELLVHFESPAPRWSNAGLVGFIISGIWISANTIYKAIIISIQFTLIPKFYCHYLCPVSWFWWLLNDWMRYDALFCRLLQEVGTGVLETGVQSETRLISRNFGKHHWILDDGIFFIPDIYFSFTAPHRHLTDLSLVFIVNLLASIDHSIAGEILTNASLIMFIAVITVLDVDRLSSMASLHTEFGTGNTRVAIRPDQLGQILPRNNHNMVLVEMSKGNRAFKTDKPETCQKHSKNVCHSEKPLL